MTWWQVINSLKVKYVSPTNVYHIDLLLELQVLLKDYFLTF